MLKHGADIMAEYPTPPVFWSEEGCEATHKFDRHRRQNRARKCDIDSNVEDMVVLQACSADYIISGYIQPYLKRQKEEYSPKMKALLVESEAEPNVESDMETDAPQQSDLDAGESSENDSESESEMDTESVGSDYDSDSDIESDEDDREYSESEYDSDNLGDE